MYLQKEECKVKLIHAVFKNIFLIWNLFVNGKLLEAAGRPILAATYRGCIHQASSNWPCNHSTKLLTFTGTMRGEG